MRQLVPIRCASTVFKLKKSAKENRSPSYSHSNGHGTGDRPIRLVRFWAYYFGVAMQGHIANRFPIRTHGKLRASALAETFIYFNKHFFKFFIRNAWETNRENFDRLFPNAMICLQNLKKRTRKDDENTRGGKKNTRKKRTGDTVQRLEKRSDKLDQKVSDGAATQCSFKNDKIT